MPLFMRCRARRRAAVTRLRLHVLPLKNTANTAYAADADEE